MNEAISKYQKREDDFIILDNRNRKKFLDELQDGEIYVEILQKKSKLRTYLQNRYLWGGVYSEFVPDHFQTVNDAHEHFTYEYLRTTGLYTEDDTVAMQKELSTARKIIKSIMKDNILAVEYIPSTTSLSTKKFNNYIEMIKVKAAELGLHIKEPEEFYDN